MEIRYRAYNNNDDIIFCSLNNSDKLLLTDVSAPTLKIGNKRAGKITAKYGYVVGFTSNKDLLKSSSKFRTNLSVIADSLKYLDKIINDSNDKLNKSTSRLLHNLTSLNAHNIQEIYSLVPQDLLAKKASGQVRLVEKIIKQESREASLCLLRLAKNNIAMKTEFSVFNKLFDKNPNLQFKFHNVHKVMMNILYLFFADFTDKNVNVKIDCEGKKTAFFDYESIHVALFHLIENAVKYVQPNTELNIKISEVENQILITFEMDSVQITKEEVDLLFDEGISGEYSKSSGKSGSGIGLSRAKNILELNSSSITIDIDEDSLHGYNSIPYQRNKFTIVLNRDISVVDDN